MYSYIVECNKIETDRVRTKEILVKDSKIIISKLLNKKQLSTRKLSKSLKRDGITVSHKSMQRYSKTTLRANSYKTPLQHRLSIKQKQNR